MAANSHIKCNVSKCKFNDTPSHCCSLTDIIVGNSTPDPHDKCDTECDSFEEKIG